MKHIVMSLLFLLFLISTGYPGDKDAPPPDYKGVVAEQPKLTVGDRWDYLRRDKTVSYEFAGEKDHLLVFNIQWDDGTKESEFRNVDLNFLKNVDYKGELYEEVEPYRGWMSFPLWVGKRWNYTFRTSHTKRAASESAPIDADVKVVAYEQVKVPAGTFWAFKIEETRTMKSSKKGQFRTGYHVTAWYCPDIRGVVKIEQDNDVYNRDLTKFTPAK